MSGSKKTTHPRASRVDGGEGPPPGPPRAQSRLPRDHPWGKEGRKRLSAEPMSSSAPFPSSDGGRFLLSSTYWIGRKQLRIHLIFNGSSCLQDTEEQSKRTQSTCKQKCTSSLVAFFFFSSGRATCVWEEWKREHWICKYPAVFPNPFASSEAKQSWWRGGGALLVLYKTAMRRVSLKTAETDFSVPINKQSPLAMHPRETTGRPIRRQHQGWLPKQQVLPTVFYPES